jgi:hypothetical protein
MSDKSYYEYKLVNKSQLIVIASGFARGPENREPLKAVILLYRLYRSLPHFAVTEENGACKIPFHPRVRVLGMALFD